MKIYSMFIYWKRFVDTYCSDPPTAVICMMMYSCRPTIVSMWWSLRDSNVHFCVQLWTSHTHLMHFRIFSITVVFSRWAHSSHCSFKSADSGTAHRGVAIWAPLYSRVLHCFQIRSWGGLLATWVSPTDCSVVFTSSQGVSQVLRLFFFF